MLWTQAVAMQNRACKKSEAAVGASAAALSEVVHAPRRVLRWRGLYPPAVSRQPRTTGSRWARWNFLNKRSDVLEIT
jgi:hypothetical protein